MKCKDITKQNSSFALDVSVSVHYRSSKITVSGAASSMSDSETSGEGGGGGSLLEAACLTTFLAFRVGAYSRLDIYLKRAGTWFSLNFTILKKLQNSILANYRTHEE